MAAFLNNILLGKTYIAIEFFTDEEREKIAFLKVQKKGNELAITQTEVIEHPEDISIYKSTASATLIINNENVLQKEIHGTETVDRKLLHKAFPSLSVDDFYYEIWRHGQFCTVAICRKTYINELVDKINKDFNIAAISLGSTSLSALSGFSLPPVLSTNTNTLTFDDSERLIGPKTIFTETHSINGLEVPSTHLLGFSGILRLLLPVQNTGSLIELGNSLNDRFMQKTFFTKGLKLVIIVLLGLLLINFLLFTYYFDKAAEMTGIASSNKAGIENSARLKKRIIEKQQRVETFSGSSRSASSLVINDLVKNIPSSILLTKIDYHPLEKKVKETEAIVTRDSLILMSGITLSNVAFTQWIEDTGKSKWVDATTITSFGKDQENNTSFSVTITLKK